MKFSKKFLAILLVLIAVVGITLYFEKRMIEEKRFMKKIEEKVANFIPYIVNDCEIIMRQQNLSYALCTRVGDKTVLKTKSLDCGVQIEKVKKCKDLRIVTNFKPGDYLGFQLDLTKFDIPFKEYYTCLYTDMPLYVTKYPPKYGEITPGIYYPSFACSPKFKKGDYHHWALSGYVLNKKGEFVVARVYVFDGNLPSDFDFKNNLDKGIIIFELKGVVE